MINTLLAKVASDSQRFYATQTIWQQRNKDYITVAMRIKEESESETLTSIQITVCINTPKKIYIKIFNRDKLVSRYLRIKPSVEICYFLDTCSMLLNEQDDDITNLIVLKEYFELKLHELSKFL